MEHNELSAEEKIHGPWILRKCRNFHWRPTCSGHTFCWMLQLWVSPNMPRFCGNKFFHKCFVFSQNFHNNFFLQVFSHRQNVAIKAFFFYCCTRSWLSKKMCTSQWHQWKHLLQYILTTHIKKDNWSSICEWTAVTVVNAWVAPSAHCRHL